MPESVWKAYIDFEIQINEPERVRDLYERLLSLTKHVKVWISYAKSEADYKLGRSIYEKDYNYFKNEEPEAKEERIMIIENWQ